MRRSLSLTAFLLICACVSLTLAAEPARPPEPLQDRPLKLPPPPPKEVLERIQAPTLKHVVKTKQGYTVEIDRSQQALAVSLHKSDIWLAAKPAALQTVEVTTADAPLQSQKTTLARLALGRILFTTAEDPLWVQTQILQNGEIVTGWVQKKHVKPVAEASRPQKRLNFSDDYASAAMLMQKGKQFDDGLYAAVDLALQNGLGTTTGKKDWLPRLAAAVPADKGGAPLATLLAATQLSGQPAKIPAELIGLKDKILANFLADEKRSKPIGFYTWSQELESIFRQDRMLQAQFIAKEDAAGVIALGQALVADASLRESYEQTLRLNERLTNRLTTPGLREVLAAIDAGKTPEFNPNELVNFLPPSRSHESDLIMKLFANQAIPADFDLMAEVIKRLKDGRVSFQPAKDSGWYDHQLWSLESLVRFDKSREGGKIQPNDLYRQHLEDLFKGTYAMMRETHIKQLAVPAPASEAPPREVREQIYIAPDPRVELLPTMYLRRAASYRFVRDVLIEAFGRENVARLHRQTATGPVEMHLLQELEFMAGLFGGAYVTACRETGLAEDAIDFGSGKPAAEQARGFLQWLAALRSDPDLAPDTRMMVPVFYDQQREQTKVWLMLGWDGVYSSIEYAQQPAVKITDRDGQVVSGETGPEVIFGGSYRELATPVFAEVYVSKILNRAEFRRHCDVYQTKGAILANLE